MFFLIPRKVVREFQENQNNQYFLCLLLNWKKVGGILLTRTALAFNLKHICLGKQHWQKVMQIQSNVIVWAGFELHLVKCQAALTQHSQT